jgi:hypothetical protein
MAKKKFRDKAAELLKRRAERLASKTPATPEAPAAFEEISTLPLVDAPSPGPGGATVDPLADLKRHLRWEKTIVSDPKAREITTVHRTLMKFLKDQGASPAALNRIRKLGPELLRETRLPKAVLGAALTVGERDILVDTFEQARTAYHGLRPKALKEGYTALLRELKNADVPPEIIAELRKASPQTLLGPRPSEVLQVLASRGKDGRLAQVWNRLRGKGPTPQVPANVLETVAAESGPVSKVAKAAATGVLAAKGVRGFSGAARTFRGVGGGWGLAGIAGGALMSAQSIYNMAYGNQARAEETALQGAPIGGPGVRSIDLLTKMLEDRDALARRKVVATTREPELTQQVIQAMMGERPTPSPLTKSEMRVGTGAGKGVLPGKQEKDIMEMVETLLSQMGSQ